MKASSILIRPTVQLHSLPDAERDIIRRFWTQHVRGMDAKHDKRWRRLGRDLFNAEPGEGIELLRPKPRSLKFHKRWMAIERRIFENQDAYVHLERFRDWLKTGAGWGAYHLVNGAMKFVPASVSFDEASDDEMREFAEAAVDFLHTDRATRKLWRHLPAAKRQEMLDTLLANPREQDQ